MPGLFRQWRIPVIVAAVHVAALSLLVLLQPSKRPPVRPPAIRVGLASIHSPALPSPRESAPPRTDVQRGERPTVDTSASSNRRISPKPKKTWRARTPEEIRRDLKHAAPPQPDPTPKRPRREIEMDELRAMVREFARDAHASNQHGEPTTVPDDYMTKVHAQLHGLWHQPTRTEVDDRRHAVMINIEIRKSGRVSASSITRPSGNVTVNQSVKSLLNRLKTLPPLPTSHRGDFLRLSVTLRLE